MDNPFREAQFKAAYPRDVHDMVLHTWGLAPLQEIGVWRLRRLYGVFGWPPVPFTAPPALGVESDTVPTPSGGVLNFVLEDRLMRAYRGLGNFERGYGWRMQWPMNDEEKQFNFNGFDPEASFTVPFQEPFTVVLHGEDYFLITESGAVYAVPNSIWGRIPRLVYRDDINPVRALIRDADSGKAFAFTSTYDPTDPDRRSSYFEVCAEPVLRPYAIQPLRVIKDEALRPVVEYARVLHKDGAIK